MGSFRLPKTENLQLFDIEFDNATGVVYAGQEIRGRVLIMYGDELVTLKSVRVRIMGRARTSWPDDRYFQLPVQERAIEHVICQAEELFFEKTLTLHGKPPGEQGSTRRSNRRREALNVGVYEFPFRCEIPATAPTTYEGEHGHIRYVCCASVSTPWKHDRQAKRAFTVIRPCDLNMYCLADYGSVEEPVSNEANLVLNSGCCVTRKVNEIAMIVKLPKSGFVCGEHIPIWANVANNTSQKLKKVRILAHHRSVLRQDSVS